MLAGIASCSPALAQNSISSFVDVGVANSSGILNLGSQSNNDNSLSSTAATQSFTGMDRSSSMRTMTFGGSVDAQADYGVLRARASADLTNSYYNSSNPAYVTPSGQLADSNGSPTYLAAAGFASFTDTLSFTGVHPGDKVRYIFHVDGIATGDNTLANLSINVNSASAGFFSNFATGPFAADWVSSDLDVYGASSQQTLAATFSAQINYLTPNIADGTNLSGNSDFFSTARLSGIQVVDSGGNPTGGWSALASSGTQYNYLVQVPEPGALALTLLGTAGFAMRPRRRK